MPVSVCPVCQVNIDADETAFSHHVSGHFEASDKSSDASNSGHGGAVDEDLLWEDENGELVAAYGGAGTSSSSGVILTACPVCSLSWSFMNAQAKELHVASHFDEDAPAPMSSASVSTGSSVGKRSRTTSRASNSTMGSQKRSSRDVAWSSTAATPPPQNVTSGVIPVLKAMLEKSATTRSAVLCDAKTLYITTTPLFDLMWGCGYRNLQMAYSAAREVLPPPLNEPPTVFDFQTWIEDAWRDGFDEVGRKQLGGRLVGRSKWIGTADVWVGLSAQGIRCKLFDFPEMSQKHHTHSALTRWVVDYFKPDSAHEGNAFGNLMASQGAKVRLSGKPPLILQHQGHSRTIVGVETLLNGETNLLVFDPGKTIPTAIRTEALEAARTPPLSSSSSEYEIPAGSDAAQSKKRSAEERGSTRKKLKALFSFEGSHLKLFRVNMKTLKRNSAYQIMFICPLAGYAQPLMDAAERGRMRVVVSERIVK